MTLDEAIGNAFGLSEFVRREKWDDGSMAVINPLSTDRYRPFVTTMGRKTFVHPTPSTDDLSASDWYPCDLRGRRAGEDWRSMLSVRNGREKRLISRRDECAVRLNGVLLEGDWRIVWVVPYNVWLWATEDSDIAWPTRGQLLSQGLPPLSVSASGVDLHLRLHQVDEMYAEEGRLFRLLVTKDKAHSGEAPAPDAAKCGQDQALDARI